MNLYLQSKNSENGYQINIYFVFNHKSYVNFNHIR